MYNGQLYTILFYMPQILVKKYIVVSLLVLVLCFPVTAQKIFVLYSYNNTYPWVVEFEKGLYAAAKESGKDYELYVENLDSTRFPDIKFRENFTNYLSQKYNGIQFDGIIGVSDEACYFIDESCRFPENIPRVYYTATFDKESPQIYNLSASYDSVIDECWDLIREIYPALSNVAVIEGDSYTTTSIYTYMQQLVKQQAIPIRLIQDYTFEELYTTVANLPEGTAVLYLPVYYDSTGKASIPSQVVREVAFQANAPVFSFWDIFMNTGCAGGRVISASATAKASLLALADYSEDGAFGTRYAISRTILDRNVIDRFSLRVDRIPEDAEVINEPPPVYVRRARAVLQFANYALSVFIAMLLAGSILLVRAYNRLRITNRELRSARKEAEDLSLTDSLTGLLNRRAFEPMVDHEMQRRNRFGSTACLCIADIDHFKKINDVHGHDIGDIVLQRIADVIKGTIRSADVLARWGGEEFIIVLPDANEEQGFLIAEKIRENVMRIEFTQCPSVTISLGITESKPDETFGAWFKRTDLALYRAKDEGRNRTIVDSGGVPGTVQKGKHELLLLQISWRDEYRVGVHRFDSQHRDLFSFANQLIYALVNDESEAVLKEMIVKIFVKARQHFMEEEKYLKRKKYPRLDRHHKEHEILLSTFSDKIALFQKGTISAWDFGDYVCNELIAKHIMKEDKLSFEAIV